MSVLDFFKPVSSISTKNLLKLIEKNGHESINVIDVRQRKEYEGGHIPGAQHIPVGELPSRLGELDRNRLTVTY